MLHAGEAAYEENGKDGGHDVENVARHEPGDRPPDLFRPPAPEYRRPARRPKIRFTIHRPHHQLSSALDRDVSSALAFQMSVAICRGNHRLTTGTIQPHIAQPRFLAWYSGAKTSALTRVRWNQTTKTTAVAMVVASCTFPDAPYSASAWSISCEVTEPKLPMSLPASWYEWLPCHSANRSAPMTRPSRIITAFESATGERRTACGPGGAGQPEGGGSGATGM